MVERPNLQQLLRPLAEDRSGDDAATRHPRRMQRAFLQHAETHPARSNPNAVREALDDLRRLLRRPRAPPSTSMSARSTGRRRAMTRPLSRLGRGAAAAMPNASASRCSSARTQGKGSRMASWLAAASWMRALTPRRSPTGGPSPWKPTSAHRVGSGVVVVDVDPRNGGGESSAWLELELGVRCPQPDVHHGGGGEHRYFRDGRGEVKLGAVSTPRRGYVVLPPSMHPSGAAYRWAASGNPLALPLAEPPDRWLDTATKRPASRPAIAAAAPPAPRTTTAAGLSEHRGVGRLRALSRALGTCRDVQSRDRAGARLRAGRGRRARLLVTEYNPRCQPRWRSASSYTRSSRLGARPGDAQHPLVERRAG